MQVDKKVIIEFLGTMEGLFQMDKRQLDSQLQQRRLSRVKVFKKIKIITADLCLRPQRQFQDKKEQDADSPGEVTCISGECHAVIMSSCQRSHNQRMLNKLSSLHRATPEAV